MDYGNCLCVRVFVCVGVCHCGAVFFLCADTCVFSFVSEC